MREDEGLKALGQKTVYKSDYAPEVLETFRNKHPENDYWVRFNCPEFTSLCPITGQPDFAEIRIMYIPGELMVESKSLKLYLFSFRNHGDFHEDCVNVIMKDLIKLISFLLLMASSGLKAQTEQSDSILRTLKEELNYSMVQLKQKPVPAYFMSLRMQDSQSLSINSVFGSASVNDNHSRFIVPNIRIGSKELDNYKFENQGIEQANNRGAQGDGVAISGGPLRQYRDEIWHASMNRYRTAVKRYEEAVAKSRTDAQFEDKSPCFSDAPVESYYEAALSPWVVDTLAWKNKLNRVSSVFKECRMLEAGLANIEFGTTRTYIVNSDGTSVVQNRRSVRIVLQAMVLATDGMQCPLYEDFFGFSEAELPSEEVLVAKAHDIVNRLLALRDAPLADPYAGPAILSGSASGVFFHEIFGHRLESHRMKKGGETFKHMVGERVLPASFSVYCDPTQNYFGKQALNGSWNWQNHRVSHP